MDEDMMKAIQGHENGEASANYGEYTVKAMKRALDMFPRIVLADPMGEDPNPDPHEREP